MQCARPVLLVLFLLAGSLSPPCLQAQESRSPPTTEAESPRGFYLEQNYPNPVNPETWIPFELEETLFANGDSVVVTIRIFNILSQLVAIPEAYDRESGEETPILNLRYHEAGRKIAYWNGRDTTGRRVPSGVYYCQLVVNGEPYTKKITVLNPERGRGIIPWF